MEHIKLLAYPVKKLKMYVLQMFSNELLFKSICSGQEDQVSFV